MSQSKSKSNSKPSSIRNRRTYSDEIKETARARVAAGETQARVARGLGIAKSTLHSWLSQADRDGHEEAREDRKAKFIDKAWENIENALIFGNQKIKIATISQENFNDTIERFIELLEEARQRKEISALEISNVVTALASLMKIPLKDVSTYIGTLYDKIALASGEPTSRSEEKKTVEDVALKEVLKNVGTERTEIIRVIRNAAFTGGQDNSGNGSADLGSAIQNYRR